MFVLYDSGTERGHLYQVGSSSAVGAFLLSFLVEHFYCNEHISWSATFFLSFFSFSFHSYPPHPFLAFLLTLPLCIP